MCCDRQNLFMIAGFYPNSAGLSDVFHCNGVFFIAGSTVLMSTKYLNFSVQ